MNRDWIHVVGHSPDFHVLLHIEVIMSIMTCTPAWTGPPGMLSTPGDFHFSNALSGI